MIWRPLVIRRHSIALQNRGMPKRIRLSPYLTDHELHKRYRHSLDPVERSRWQFLWLLARGLTAMAIARVTGYSAYWIGQIARRFY